jgi:hypothetical protein
MENEIIYLKSNQTKIVFDSMSYTKFRVSIQTGQITWRCSQAGCLATLKSIGGLVTTPAKSHQRTCILIEPIEAACLIKYEELKDKCLQPGFVFYMQYTNALMELQSKHDNQIVSLFWPSIKAATNCIESIRRRRSRITVFTPQSVNSLEPNLSTDTINKATKRNGDPIKPCTYKKAKTTPQEAQAPLQEAQASIQEAQTSIQIAQAKLQEAQAKLQEAQATLQEAKSRNCYYLA